MSTFTTQPVRCPSCGIETAREVARTINVTRGPKYREAILARRFQSFECPSCRQPSHAAPDFVYVDFERRQLIAVLSERLERAWWEHEAVPQAAYDAGFGPEQPSFAQVLGADFAVRVVFGLDALREKLVAFEAGLDDAWLETHKLLLLRESPGLALNPAARPRLMAADGTRLVMVLRAPMPQGEGWQLRELTVARRDHDALTRNPSLDATVTLLSAGPYVDLGRVFFAPAMP